MFGDAYNDVDVLLKNAVIGAVQQIDQIGYTGIIISGRSTLITDSWLRAGWQRAIKTPIPNIYDFECEGNALLYKPLDYQGYGIDDRTGRVSRFIDKKFPDLSRETKPCYLGEYSGKGKKYRAMKEIFPQVGLGRTEFVFFLSEDDPELEEDAFVSVVDTYTKNRLQRIYEALVSKNIGERQTTAKEVRRIAEFIRSE